LTGGLIRAAARLLPAAAVAALLALLALIAGAVRVDAEQDLLRALLRPRPQPAPAKARLDLSQSTSELVMAAALLLRGYQLFLSSQDGPRCQFTPSCSEYARIAIRLHGLPVGLLMASDRYQRCNGLRPERYPLDPRTGKRLDPPPGVPAGGGPP
jgi:putative component of membrane protein insertase Oxa1/YidC/SpoIIIJ protein YidD